MSPASMGSALSEAGDPRAIAAAEFIDLLLRALGGGEGLSTTSGKARSISQAAGLSERQVHRWAQGRALPRHKSFEKLTAGVSGEAKASLETAYRHIRRVWKQQLTEGPKTTVSQFRHVSELGLTGGVLETHLSRLHDRGMQLRSWWSPASGPIRIQILRGNRMGSVAHSVNPVEELRALLGHRSGRTPTRILLVGRPASGKSRVCEDLAAHLAKDFSASMHRPSLVPLPVLVDWTEWWPRLRDLDQDHTAVSALAASMLNAAGLSLGEKDSLGVVRSSMVTVFMDNVELAEARSKPSLILALRKLIGSTVRLVMAGHELQDLEAADPADQSLFTHRVTIMPSNMLDVAADARKRLRVSDPKLQHLGLLGDNIRFLERPGIAGRVLAQISSGEITSEMLTSETILLASLFVVDVVRREGMQYSPEQHGPCPALDGLKPALWHWWEDLLQSLLKRDPEKLAAMAQHKSRLLKEQGWIDERIEDALVFLLAYVKGKRLAEKGEWEEAGQRDSEASPQFDTEQGQDTDRFFSVPGSPFQRLTAREDVGLDDKSVVVVPLLHRLDPEALAVLAAEIPETIWEPVLWRETIDGVNAILDCACDEKNPDRSVPDLWRKAERVWPAYLGALGVLRGCLSHSDGEHPALQKKRDEVIGKLRDFYHLTHVVPALGNFRHYGARAVGTLIDYVDLNREIEELRTRCHELSEYTDGVNAGLVKDLGSDVAFFADAAVHFHRPPIEVAIQESEDKVDEHCARDLPGRLCALLDDLGDAIDPVDDWPHLRHARYHLLHAVARMAPPNMIRATFRQIAYLPQREFWSERTCPQRAVECAIAVGKLYQVGDATVGMFSSSLAWELARLAELEVSDSEYWNREDGPGGRSNESTPTIVRTHLFGAYRWLSPLMTRPQRQKLVSSLSRHLAGDGRTPGFPPTETAALRTLLFWIREELRRGSMPDSEGLAELKKLHDTLQHELKSPTPLTETAPRYRPDKRNLEYLQQLIEIIELGNGTT